jgi:hypothetical protein
MGYRSVVEIVMYPTKSEDFAMLKLYVDESLPDKFEVAGGDRKVLHLRLEDVKWYPSYEEVQAYLQCFANWEGIFGGRCHYEFIRIGEETGDVEHESSDGAEYLLQVATTIEHDFV